MMHDGHLAFGNRYGSSSYKKKSSFWTWAVLVLLLLAMATLAGFHFGINDILKVTADRRAVASEPVPLSIPKQAEGSTSHLFWRDETFEDGLRCRLFKRKGTGATPEFIHPDHISCDWANHPQR